MESLSRQHVLDLNMKHLLLISRILFIVLLPLGSLPIDANSFDLVDHHEEKDLSRFDLGGLNLRKTSPPQESARQLLRELNQRTQVDPHDDAWHWMSSKDILKAPPLLWIFVDGQTIISKEVIDPLQRYLSNGGTIIIEGTGPTSQNTMRSLREALFTKEEIRPLASDALLTRTFYILPPNISSSLKTMLKGGRVVWIESHSPLLSDLNRNHASREMKVRACLNIVLYTLTGNYKDDLTHLKYLMRRRKS
jgi:hypothetical protein